MQATVYRHRISQAVLILMGLTSAAHADTTVYDRQERAGLMLNIPFDSTGLKFKDSVLSLVYQDARVKSSVTGWQLAFGSKLTSFSPVFAVSAIGGDRCGYGAVGVSYGDGKWGLPIGIYGPYIQVGLANSGGFGGFQAGLSSLGCFKRYAPPVAAPAPAPAPTPAPEVPSGDCVPAASVDVRAASAWIRSNPGATDFDWA
jgi:hypothetical protein